MLGLVELGILLSLGGLCLLGGIAGIVFVSRQVSANRTNRQNAWQECAARRGWRITGNFPLYDVTGEIDGLAFSVNHHLERRRVDRGRTVSIYNANVGVMTPAPIGDLHVRRASFFERGPNDVQTGDPQFDPSWVVSCTDPRFLQAGLTPAVRAALGRIPGNVSISQGAVRWSREGGTLDAVECERLLASLVAVVRSMAAA